jgi:ubiquitin-conjugating enzyme E2 S
LTIPTTYPQQPPTANFRTPIFHPNVDPQTGGVCVETLKRDWDSKLTLRDVLVTISCLLIQPNPDSALNAEAGGLIQENYEAFTERAELMTSIHALIPKNLLDAVREAQNRGQDDAGSSKARQEEAEPVRQIEAPVKRRRVTARQRGTRAARRSNGSPTEEPVRRRVQQPSRNPFVLSFGNDDTFGNVAGTQETPMIAEDDDSSMIDADQENDESRSPTKATTPPRIATPRRPLGAPVPLGELTLDDRPPESSDDEADSEPEYPPSPRKSPKKSPIKHRPQLSSNDAESSRTAAMRAPNITPPTNLFAKPLAEDSPFVASSSIGPSTSPRKKTGTLFTPGLPKAPLFPLLHTPAKHGGGIFKQRSPSSSEKKREEERRRTELEAKLWDACGKNVERWNRGDFDGEPFALKARRW